MKWIIAPQTEINSIAVTVRDRSALLRDLKERLQRNSGFSVATLNLDHVVKLQRDQTFRMAYSAHTHVTADGNPIVWLSRLSGHAVSLVPGSELIEPMVVIASEEAVPVAFLGATQSSLDAAAHVFRRRYPNLDIPLCFAPSMEFDPDDEEALLAIEAIRKSGARLVFLALGAPKQERFAARAQTMLPDVGFLSIGAGLDFISGRQKRAPRLVRFIAAEWLWRLLSNPTRLAARYGSCIAILPRLTLRSLSIRWGRIIQ